MDISIDDPRTQLSDLIDQVDAGSAVTLMRDGKPLARLVPLVAVSKKVFTSEPRPWSLDELERRNRLLLEISERTSKEALPGPDAAHSADFLYDDDTGLPA